jgi:2,4-dienoyl-CoA reductase-like NADH-dependent reductase (Old Yellow Enzyme family)
MMEYRKLAQLRTAAEFRAYLESVGAALPFDEQVQAGPESPLAQPFRVHDWTVGNRFAVLPMEGWDAAPGGRPTDLVRRRWERFGISGAKLIWGGEAVAVRPDGRANPQQLVIKAETVGEIAALRDTLIRAHAERYGRTDDLLIGLQLTHSGRFARPYDKKRMEPQVLYHHPLLDRKFNVPADHPLMSDDDISRLIADFVRAARLAQSAGFQFVDIKHCHGYLGHEFLGAVDREGRYGGSFENRTRFLREIMAGIRAEAPGLEVGVRLSAFDWIPFRRSADGPGEPEPFAGAYPYAFGGDGTGTGIDLREPIAFLDLLTSLGIRLVCVTAGSPYYNPHIQRPAFFPPSDGYTPPEDPLAGVARQINAVAALKNARPDLIYVGSGYSYLQEWVPNVAQHVVRTGMADSVGLGRMVLSYPDIVNDILTGKPLQRKRLCRTFSDCTTAPRNGLISGCYPLDDFYKALPEYEQLMAIKGK